MSTKILKTQNPFLTLDTATSGNITMSPGGNSYYKLAETVILTSNRTYTLSSTGAIDGNSIYMSFIDVDFGAFSITIQDDTNLMTAVNFTSSTTHHFKFLGGQWYRII
jgi:hypothetical protein